MNKNSCFYIGFIAKKNSFKGEISIKLNVQNLKDCLNLDFIYIDIDGQLIPYKIHSSFLKKNLFLQLKLEEINDEVSAKSLIGKEVFLNKNMLPNLKKNDFFYHEIIGYKIISMNGENIGTVTYLNDQSSQTLIVLENNNGQKKIIPLVQEFIKKIDKKNKLLTVSLPEGLLDLNFK